MKRAYSATNKEELWKVLVEYEVAKPLVNKNQKHFFFIMRFAEHARRFKGKYMRMLR